MLVFIGQLSLSTLRWVPMWQVFNYFSDFLHHFVFAKLATTSIREKIVNSNCLVKLLLFYLGSPHLQPGTCPLAIRLPTLHSSHLHWRNEIMTYQTIHTERERESCSLIEFHHRIIKIIFFNFISVKEKLESIINNIIYSNNVKLSTFNFP